MNSTFKKVALASALLASSALVAPQAAFAVALVTASTQTNTAAVTANDGSAVGPSKLFNGTEKIFAGYGKKLRVQWNVGDGTGNGQNGNITAVAMLYKDGTYIGTSTTLQTVAATDTEVSDDATAADGDNKIDLSFDITNAPSAFNQVVIVFTSNNALDTINGAAPGTGMVALVSNTSNSGSVKMIALDGNGSTNSAVDLTAAADVNTLATTIGALSAADKAEVLIPVESYDGPKLLGGVKNTADAPTAVTLQFDVPVAKVTTGLPLTDTYAIAADVTIKNAAGSSAATVAVDVGAIGSVPALAIDHPVRRFRVNTNGTGGAFSGTTATAEVPFKTGSSTTLVDFALNSLFIPVSAQTISLSAKPALASTGTAKNVLVSATSDGTTAITESNIRDLYSDTGMAIANTYTLTFSSRLEQAFAASTLNTVADELDVAGLPAGTSNANYAIIADGSSGTTSIKWTAASLPSTSPKIRVNSSGQLQYTADSTVTTPAWVDVKLGYKYNATTPIATADGVAMASSADDIAAVAVYGGIAPTVTVATDVATLDKDANGTVDGAVINFGAPITTPLAATHGAVIADDDDATKKSSVTVAINADSANKLNIVGVEESLKSFVNTSGTETAASTLNTGAKGTTLPFKVSVASSEITYSRVYNSSTGNLKTIGDVAANEPATDGASPVILSVLYVDEQGNSPAAGQLKIVASEALSAEDTNTGNTVGTVDLDLQQFLINGSPLTLLNLNDGVTSNAQHYTTGEKTTIAGDTVLIGKTGTGNGKVSANALNKPFAMSASSKSGLKDAAGNKLAGSVSSITTGGSVYSGPKIVQAIGTRSTNAVDGNIDTVLVKFDKAVTQATSGTTTGAVVDGMFKVRALVDGANYDVSVPAAKVTIGTDGYVTLAIPAPGIVGSTKLQGLWVEYDKDSNNALNRLVSTDSTAAEISDSGSAFSDGTNSVTKNKSSTDTTQIVDTAFTNDADTSKVQFSANTTKLYTMEVTGKLTTDGTAAAARGTIVRADLVDMGTALTVKNGSLAVPCSCAAGSTTIALGNNDTELKSLAKALDDGAKVGKSTINLYAVVTLNGNTANATNVKVLDELGASGMKSYPVSVNTTTGAITGTAGATGSLTLEKTPALKVLDTVYQVTNTGDFRFAVGSDTAPTNAFVLVSSKQPTDKFFTGLTSPVESFANHLPFASNVVSSGVIGGNLGTINLKNIASSSVSETTGWQLVGFQGAIARNGNATLKAKPVDATRLLISVRPTTGEPVTAWAFDNVTTGQEALANDEAFLLQNNVTASALQIGSASVDGLKAIDGGLALALKNPSGGFTSDTAATKGEINKDDASTGISATEPFSVFYPITGDSAAFGAAAGKWSLLTMDTGVASLSDWAATNKVAAIIVVGSGNAQKSWFKGSTTNTLTALSKGDRAFIYFEGANTAFKFGR